MNSGTYDEVTHTYSEPNNYFVTLITSNIYGCKDTLTLPVIVNEEYSIYVPNTITPDGDNKNEILYVYGTGITSEDYLFRVFDRWGLLLFETTNPLAGWDGKYKGKIVVQDTYVWRLQAVIENGEKYNLRGHVNVLK